MEQQEIKGAIFLTTERLTMVDLTIDHIDALCDLDSDPQVMHYITNGEPRPRSHNEEAVPRAIKYMAENPGLGLWPAYLNETSEFMGWYILKHLLDTGEVEVGFRIKKKFWGQGFSTEAGKTLVKHGFETVGLERIVAIVRPDNFASQAVIKKIGLNHEGQGTYHDIACLYFALDRKDFCS